MIVAITGATGFIGLRLVKRFDAGSSESCAFDEASPSAKDYLGEQKKKPEEEDSSNQAIVATRRRRRRLKQPSNSNCKLYYISKGGGELMMMLLLIYFFVCDGRHQYNHHGNEQDKQ
ncbi:hypothetical protein CY35_14G105200 [Sphagnum magellanicum]|nr:hypothetical protein CY35_14G105200 [Sphagnum magellanicum]